MGPASGRHRAEGLPPQGGHRGTVLQPQPGGHRPLAVRMRGPACQRGLGQGPHFSTEPAEETQRHRVGHPRPQRAHRRHPAGSQGLRRIRPLRQGEHRAQTGGPSS